MKNLNINWMKSVLFIGLMVLVNIEIFAQLANVRYSVRVGNIQSREFNACFEFGNEEYTAFGGFFDNVNTGLTQSGCLTCTTNGNCNYGGGTFLGTRTNNADRLYYWLHAFENDRGSRCSFNAGSFFQNGDDCRVIGSPGFVNFRNSLPSNNSYTVGPQANFGNHAIRLDWTWRYSGNANTLNPGCSAGFASYSSGAIRSWSVNMTAGRTYRFSTLGLSSEDTYIRIYSSNGYTIVASNDDANGSLQSNLNYTASSSGTYYVEVARFSRNPLNASGNLLYQDVSTPSINGGQIASSTSVCTGGNISISNVAGSSGGFGTGLSYQWQSSPNGTNWSNIGGATAATYSASNLTSTNYYRRISTDCKNTTGTSNVVVATVVAQPQVSISSAAPNATICVGGTTALTANVSGGTGSFSYQWQYLRNGNWLDLCASCTNPTQNTSPSSTLEYRVIVSNSLGCNAIATQTVTVVPDPVITLSGTDITCNGANDGTATASISGGTNQSYSINWFSDDGISSNNNPTGDGTYNVSDLEPNVWVAQTVGQQYGCFASASITISEPDLLTATSSSGNILCNGGTTSVTINAAGGTAPYSYSASTSPNSNGAISAFINEIHYDNSGADQGEAIEIAGTAGLDLDGWSICLYNGNGGSLYNTRNLSGVISNSTNGFGFVTESISGIQNGSPDGIALVDDQGSVVQFLSYEGSFTATNGPAAGLTSTSIGVSESSSTSIGFSLQLQGNGSSYADFTWAIPQANTFGSVNTGQNFGGASIPLSSNVISNVPAGTYSYTVTDANGCTATTSITVSEPSLLTSNSTSGAILCFGGTTTVNVTANGGTAPYTGTGAFTVTAGTYSYTVTDANGCTATTSITINQPTQVIANAGSDQIVYYGYAPLACATLSASAFGGTGAISYQWFDDNGNSVASTATVNVCPSTTTTYQIVATDGNGCTATDQVTVCVVDVVCYAGNSNNAKVEMCHIPPGNPGNAHTICVNANAVPAHLANGSTLGSCAETGACIAARIFQNSDNTAEETPEKEYIFKLFPNPTSGSLNIQFSQIINKDFQIELIDLLGRVIHTELPLGDQTISLDISHLSSGSYLIRVIDQQGNYNTQQFIKK